MNKAYYAITQMIKSAITEKSVAIPDEVDWKEVAKTAFSHKIEVLIYYGAYYSKVSLPEGYKNILEKCVFAQSNLDAQQDYEISRLLEAFDNNNITYMSLKGALIKKLYPKSEMRYMGDADILIKASQYLQIEAIMSELGYSFHTESNHEYVWMKQNICVELHKRLIPSYNKDYYRYYGDGWQLAKLSDGRYRMSDEDFYIYLFTHLAKHYRDRGVGIKQFVDLWVYRKSVELDDEYINAELKRLQLLEFYQNSLKMLGVWFEGKDEDGITEHMTSIIFSSGVYGTEKSGEMSNALRQTALMKNKKNFKARLFLNSIFLPYDYMSRIYPILKKIPLLLPIMWIVRIFNAVLFKKGKIRSNIQKASMLRQEDVNAYSKSLEYVGLKFDFKEQK